MCNLSDFMLLGDFNIDFLNTHSAQFCKLSDIMSNLFLIQTVSEPTRPSVNGSPGSLLDLVFISHPLDLISCQTIPALSNSDQLGLSITVSVGGLVR